MSAATESLRQSPAFRDFVAHASACPKCERVDLERSAALVHACLEGSRTLKDAYAEHARRGERG